MKICIIGQGYVGLSLAIAAAEATHKVTGFDTNQQVINNIISSNTSVNGISRSQIDRFIKNFQYTATSNPNEMKDCEIIIIAVPTPLNENREPNVEFLLSASKLIGENAANGTLIINESTSYPGTLRNLIKPVIEQSSNFNFLYAASPERVDPASESWNLNNTPRVISGLTEEATNLAKDFYQSFCKKIIIVSTPETAEASKLFENTFRQLNIALANEFSEIASHLNFSASEAIKAASTKPFGFIPFYPGVGVGGHCIPIDPSYLSHSAKKKGASVALIELANEINLFRPKIIANRIKGILNNELSGKEIQIAGISYKPEVSDMRESPAIVLIQELTKLGANVFWHDPLVEYFNGQTSRPLATKIDLGIIVSPHKEINFAVWLNSEIPVIDLSSNSKNYGWPKFF